MMAAHGGTRASVKSGRRQTGGQRKAVVIRDVAAEIKLRNFFIGLFRLSAPARSKRLIFVDA